jgi:hypothetical protein
MNRHHIIRKLLPFLFTMGFSLFFAFVGFTLKRSGMLGVSLFSASLKSYAFYAGMKRDMFLRRLRQNPELWRLFQQQGRDK